MMNIINGIITNIESHEGMSLIKVRSNDVIFTAIVLDTPETSDYLKIENDVNVIFKETEVMISKDLTPNISVQNKLHCVIESIQNGVILSQINLRYDQQIIKSIITRNACEQLDLKEKDTVLALIKTNEVSLSAHD
ncbi:TOBE domain-containing protein [Flavobacterium phragmitis]|uniref:Molybdenum-pterin binding domain-containing protein n=1 Tax=Flavobacterium phragmitis TaxID=739143 RepID=A0A1I1WPQ6_9FLAO|nr:TOBE domain-containing protein [Flavobacterium phragmitis]SFD96378.1 molybdenum-pterin binding domain-containing protein [Flavobacterium phragmitis]